MKTRHRKFDSFGMTTKENPDLHTAFHLHPVSSLEKCHQPVLFTHAHTCNSTKVHAQKYFSTELVVVLSVANNSGQLKFNNPPRILFLAAVGQHFSEESQSKWC